MHLVCSFAAKHHDEVRTFSISNQSRIHQPQICAYKQTLRLKYQPPLNRSPGFSLGLFQGESNSRGIPCDRTRSVAKWPVFQRSTLLQSTEGSVSGVRTWSRLGMACMGMNWNLGCKSISKVRYLASKAIFDQGRCVDLTFSETWGI